MQAWAGPNSTELRLVCQKPYNPRKRYDSKHLEEAMAWYNRRGRNDMQLQRLILSRYMKGADLPQETRALCPVLFWQFMDMYLGKKTLSWTMRYTP